MAQQGLHGIWSHRWTFILAATGSAVGLGNIWKFPYMTGENGGGAFVLVYLVCIALIGIPVMMAEVLLGRRGRLSPINTMRRLAAEAGAAPAWAHIGHMGVLAGLLIMAFYSVVAGWGVSYTLSTALGDMTTPDTALIRDHFSQLLANPYQLLLWHSVFCVMTALVVSLGVQKGLGAAANVMMPLLFLCLLLLVGYSCFYGEFLKGAHFLLDFNLANLTWQSVLKAMGHAFFTLSLGMGAIMAYGAYMPAQTSIGKTIITVGLMDTLVALLAGLAIFPLVFANPPLEPGAGPGLVFVTLPIAFAQMPWGTLIGTLFFILIVLAAWTSSVSLIEPGVAWLIETKRWRRWQATFLLTLCAWFLGIACALSFNYLADYKPWYFLYKTPFDFLDFLTSQIMLPLGGLGIALFVGFCMNKNLVAAEMNHPHATLFKLWHHVLRYVSPLLIATVMVLTLLDSLKAIL